jgi:hypothetical protein
MAKPGYMTASARIKLGARGIAVRLRFTVWPTARRSQSRIHQIGYVGVHYQADRARDEAAPEISHDPAEPDA